jgi:hypothetical protein|tara:strand:- start:163 stop:414 length:252 start_codon:yes stop_codon:yes gene_type:complete
MDNVITKYTEVNNPGYYKNYKIEPVDFIMKNHIPYAEGNVIKYICRWQKKHDTPGNQLEDLLKAKRYVDFLIRQVKQQIRKEK